MEGDKQSQMRKLVQLRRSGWIPDGCYRLGDKRLNDGFWDEDEHVVPWSKTACNYDSEVMLIAQDWDSLDNLTAPLAAKHHRIKLVGRNEKLATNKRIDKLLAQYLALTWSDIFATDVFPFIKPGDMRGNLRLTDLVRCAHDFALPQIDIIRPLLVICLGRSTTFRAIAAAIGQRFSAPNGDDPLGPVEYRNVKIYGVTHPGGRGNAWVDRIDKEWARLSSELQILRKQIA
jgi:restriction system protein